MDSLWSRRFKWGCFSNRPFQIQHRSRSLLRLIEKNRLSISPFCLEFVCTGVVAVVASRFMIRFIVYVKLISSLVFTKIIQAFVNLCLSNVFWFYQSPTVHSFHNFPRIHPPTVITFVSDCIFDRSIYYLLTIPYPGFDKLTLLYNNRNFFPDNWSPIDQSLEHSDT